MMSSHDNKYLVEQFIEKPKWLDIMHRFVDVLRINMFLVDIEGHIIIPPVKGQGGKLSYGAEFVSKTLPVADSASSPTDFIQQFDKTGSYLEFKDPFEFHTFVIPVNVAKEGKTIAYVVVGPVILNKRLEQEDYRKVAEAVGLPQEILATINEIRIVSFVSMNSILDLLSVLIKDVIDLKWEKRNLDSIKLAEASLSRKVNKTAEEIYASIHMDELLVTLLDVALNMTKTECGSIMILDEQKGELIIKVSRGLDEKRVENTHVKIGEGIAGLVAKENTPLVIKGTVGDTRLKPLLKRPEIKQSIVMPLNARNRVLGVLNLHTKNEESKIEGSLENLQCLSKLISTAFTFNHLPL